MNGTFIRNLSECSVKCKPDLSKEGIISEKKIRFPLIILKRFLKNLDRTPNYPNPCSALYRIKCREHYKSKAILKVKLINLGARNGSVFKSKY